MVLKLMVGLWQDTTGYFEQMPLNGNALPDNSGMNENGPHKLIGNGTIRRYVLIGGSTSQEVGFGVSEAQARPNGSLALPAALRSTWSSRLLPLSELLCVSSQQ